MECVCCDSRPMPRCTSPGRFLKRNVVQRRLVTHRRGRVLERKSKLPELWSRIIVRSIDVIDPEVGVHSQQRRRLENQWRSVSDSRQGDGRDSFQEQSGRSRVKHAMTAAAVLALCLSLPSSSPLALALEIDRVAQVEIAGVRELQQLDGPTQLVAVNSPELSMAATSKVVQAVGSTVAAKPKAVINAAVVSSSSRIIARILQHFGGGGIAGAIGAALVYPLDTIKTRMQAQSSKDGDECKYKNEVDCFRKLVADEGVGSLYSGILPQLVGIAPEKALKLTVNELLLELLEHVMPGAGLWFLELIAGSGGGFSQVVVTNPMEIVKVRLQTQQASSSEKKRGPGEVMRELGLRGLYHGAGVTLARDIPSSGIFFACYALLHQLYPDQGFADGFLAAIPATVFSTPMDVVKTRLQMEVPEGEAPHENAVACFKSVWEAEGPGALFKGSLARVLRTSPQFGVTLVVYNFICGSGS